MLLFAWKLRFFRHMFDLTIPQMAEKFGLTTARMTDILDGEHKTGAADVLRIMKRSGLDFDPEDFERHVDHYKLEELLGWERSLKVAVKEAEGKDA